MTSRVNDIMDELTSLKTLKSADKLSHIMQIN